MWFSPSVKWNKLYLLEENICLLHKHELFVIVDLVDLIPLRGTPEQFKTINKTLSEKLY